MSNLEQSDKTKEEEAKRPPPPTSIRESWESCILDELTILRKKAQNQVIKEIGIDAAAAGIGCLAAGPAYKVCFLTGMGIGTGHALNEFADRMVGLRLPARLACAEASPMSNEQRNSRDGA